MLIHSVGTFSPSQWRHCSDVLSILIFLSCCPLRSETQDLGHFQGNALNKDYLPPPRIRTEDFISFNWESIIFTVTPNSTHLRSYPKDTEMQILVSFHQGIMAENCSRWFKFTCIIDKKDCYFDLSGKLFVEISLRKNNLRKNYRIVLDLLSQRVKPDPVKNIQIRILNYTAIELDWDNPALGYPLLYSVFMSAMNFNHQLSVDTNKSKPLALRAYVVVGGLKPHGAYNISVISHPISESRSQAELGSDPTFAAVEMPESVPAKNPEWAPAAHSIYDCRQDRCTVIVYWKKISEIDKNGKIQNIIISLTPRKGNILLKKWTRRLDPEITSYYFGYLKKGIGYTVQLQARTELGTNNESLLHPLHLSEKISSYPTVSGVLAQTSKYNNRTIVKWKNSPGMSNILGRKTFMTVVMWCERGPGNSCKGDIDHKWVAGNEETTDIVAQPSGASHQVGVALVNRNNQSGGIVWSNCVYKEGKAPGKFAPRGDVVPTSPLPGKLVITVTGYQCTEDIEPITWTQISYCKVDEQHDCAGRKYTVKLMNSELDIVQKYTVPPYDSYLITIVAYSESGKTATRKYIQFVDGEGTRISFLMAVVSGIVLVLAIIVAMMKIFVTMYKATQKAVIIKHTEYTGSITIAEMGSKEFPAIESGSLIQDSETTVTTDQTQLTDILLNDYDFDPFPQPALQPLQDEFKLSEDEIQAIIAKGLITDNST